MNRVTNQCLEKSNFKESLLMRFFLTIAFVVFLSLSLSAQNFLQLEKRGSFKTERYYEGELLIFQIENDKDWYVEEIVEIMIEEKLVLFENRVLPISKISKIRNTEKGQFWRSLGNKLMVFGVSYLGFSMLGTLVDWELRADTFVYSGSAVAVGGIMRLLSNTKIYRLGNNRWLRPMNLDFQKKKA